MHIYSACIIGKQLFETDHNLDTSDIQFLEDGKKCLNNFYILILYATYLSSRVRINRDYGKLIIKAESQKQN